VVLCLGHVLLISAQVPARSGASVLRASTLGVVAWLQGGVGGFSGGVGNLWSRYVWLGGAARENEQLRARVLALEGELQTERARAREVDALEEALGLARSVAVPTLAARVIAGSPVPGALTVTIDRGAADGVASNMAVINGQGVVGRVVGRPSERAAVVQLIVGRDAAAGAIVERDGTPGLVAGGFADGQLRLELVPPTVPIEIGDRVLTSGQDGMYPRGFLLGQVTGIGPAGVQREIVVAPAVDPTRLDVVLVVLSVPPPRTGGLP
jgi:rod shape-determining protein MreC